MANLVAENGTNLEDIFEVLQEDDTYCQMMKERDFMTSKTAPCKICGMPSIGYSYYGTVCCNACKAFFKRAIQSKQDIFCPTTEPCKENCRKCRLDKCLKAGMMPERIKKDHSLIILSKVSPTFTLEDEIWVRGLWAGAVAAAGQFMSGLDQEMPNFFKKFIQHMFDGKTLGDMGGDHFFGSPALESKAFKDLSPFYVCLPEFQTVSKHKALKWIREYLPLTAEINMAQGVTSPSTAIDFIGELATWLSRESGKKDLYDMINHKLAYEQPLGFNYEDIYPKVLPLNRTEHKEKVATIGQLPMDKIITMLVILTILLEENKAAKRKYLRMIHLYCSANKRFGDADEFVKNVACMTGTLRDLRRMRFSQVLTDETYISPK